MKTLEEQLENWKDTIKDALEEFEDETPLDEVLDDDTLTNFKNWLNGGEYSVDVPYALKEISYAYDIEKYVDGMYDYPVIKGNKVYNFLDLQEEEEREERQNYIEDRENNNFLNLQYDLMRA